MCASFFENKVQQSNNEHCLWCQTNWGRNDSLKSYYVGFNLLSCGLSSGKVEWVWETLRKITLVSMLLSTTFLGESTYMTQTQDYHKCSGLTTLIEFAKYRQRISWVRSVLELVVFFQPLTKRLHTVSYILHTRLVKILNLLEVGVP